MSKIDENKLTPPVYLNESAKVEFRRISKIMGDTLQQIDRSLLALYAQSYADVVQLTKALRKQPRFLKSVGGGQYLSPMQNLLLSREKSLNKLQNDLGMTPKSRGEKIKSGKTSAIRKALGY